MNEESLKKARDAYGASISLWLSHVNTPGGHPGISGPSGSGHPSEKPWNELESTIQSTIDTLSAVKRHLHNS